MPGVYISWPFCTQKCTFCNFASGVFPRSLETDYTEVLRQEVEAFLWPWTPETVYLGGGTPGQMSGEALAALLSRVPGRPWTEATIEAAPGGIDAHRVEGWRRAGITRVSLGVQSFVHAEIARTGRRHTASIVAQEWRILRSAGIGDINIDLIAGLPGQTEASWRTSLEWVERLGPDHVSIYMLEVDQDSRLGSEILAGGTRYGARDVPCEDRIAALYEMAVERLDSLGLRRYEISNFAQTGHESVHNLKYWLLQPYVGFGADAHSFVGGRRWSNVESPRAYVERWRQNRNVRAEEQDADPSAERFFVGLRLMAGVEPAAEEWRRYQQPIRRFLDAGLLEIEDSRLRLTPRGVLLSNEVFQEFVDT